MYVSRQYVAIYNPMLLSPSFHRDVHCLAFVSGTLESNCLCDKNMKSHIRKCKVKNPDYWDTEDDLVGALMAPTERVCVHRVPGAGAFTPANTGSANTGYPVLASVNK